METDEGRVACPDCGRRFQRRGLATHRRQAHGVAPAASVPRAPLPSLDAHDDRLVTLLAEVARGLGQLDARIGRVEAALVGQGERRTRARERAEDVEALTAELHALMAEIQEAKRALALEDTPERRRGLGALRRRQAMVLFRMGPDAPGGTYPEGEVPLTSP